MTQFGLKCIALIAMLLDHTASTVLSTGILKPWLGLWGNYAVMMTMESLGQMAFLIFAWFTAEGCRRTGNMEKYLLRLAVFAVISEVPFQLCFRENLSPGCHNVIFTMLLAAGGIHCGNLLSRRLPEPWGRLLPAAAAVALGWLLHTDYNAWGVGLILGLYDLPRHRDRVCFLIGWETVFRLVWHSWNGRTLSWFQPAGRGQLLFWLGGMAAAGLLATYAGERGRRGKWLFYWFYPVHLLALYGLTCWAETMV